MELGKKGNIMKITQANYNSSPNFGAKTIKVHNTTIPPEEEFKVVLIGTTNYGHYIYHFRNARDVAFAKFTTAIKPKVLCKRIKQARETQEKGMFDLLS